MDYNQNNNNEQWDRWNSSASNSSYYNQPTHRPYGQSFTIASNVCGILSMMTGCFALFSMPLGALGILFSSLAHRKGRKPYPSSNIGIVFSCIGLVSALVTIISSFATLPNLMKNEAFRSQFDQVTEQMYGMDFAEFMEEYYGITIED